MLIVLRALRASIQPKQVAQLRLPFLELLGLLVLEPYDLPL
jgi:hypothetical protein